MGDLLYLIIAIAVLAVLLVAGLVVRGRGKAPSAPSAPTTPSVPTTAPPEADVRVEAPVQTAPSLEKPERKSAP